MIRKVLLCGALIWGISVVLGAMDDRVHCSYGEKEDGWM